MVRGDPLGDLVLVAHGPLEHAHGRDAGEDPGEFGDLGNVLLGKKGRLLGIEAEGQEVQSHAHRVLVQELRVLHRRECVVAGDEVEGLVAGLQGDVLAQGAEVVAQMGPARRLYTGKDAHDAA